MRTTVAVGSPTLKTRVHSQTELAMCCFHVRTMYLPVFVFSKGPFKLCSFQSPERHVVFFKTVMDFLAKAQFRPKLCNKMTQLLDITGKVQRPLLESSVTECMFLSVFMGCS